ncbi:FAD-dependent oxidoreductase [Nocardia rhizosphaerae]|uniref:FAD-dependent oxidoreductase n=1 Tax=Nocardia rhizosphaerae TaxID=1691571 RepID=A0ABV8LCN4_9NOCA
MIPGAAQAWTGSSLTYNWLGNPCTFGSTAYYRRGQFTKFAGVEALREGNYHFAGEHTGSFLSGVNDAVSSGFRAVYDIISEIQY